MENNIEIESLGISLPLSDKAKYFSLIEKLQEEVQQDTYLLMDNLYEENASCIDTYSLFLYLKQNNYPAKYVVYEKNPLYRELKEKNELEDIIVCSESSLIGVDMYGKLFSTLIRTKYIILSFPESLYRDILKFAYDNKSMQVVMIGHGPVFFKTSILNFKKTKYLSPERFNLYLVSSLREEKIFLQAGWPQDRIFNIGLPRFDMCKKEEHEEKNILIMFTWRLESFRKSPNVNKLRYFKSLKSFLGNAKLQAIAKSKGYNVTIALHHSIKDLCGIDIEIPDCYHLADTTNLIKYINTADLFVTDYSSIVHDFMFLNTPVIFYRLDYGDKLLFDMDREDLEESRKKDDEIFNVFYEESDAVNKIEYYVKNNFELEDEYVKIEDSFFTEKSHIRQKFTDALENHQLERTSGLTVKPAWSNVKNAICMSSSNEYAPYLCVCLKSIIDNSSQPKDIIVFERDISAHNKKKILSYFQQDDVSIRFVNPTPLFKNVRLHVSHDYFKEECYYRISAPKILNAYDKIIFTDLDLVVRDDILKLTDIDMGDLPIAACVEPVWRELYMQNTKIYNTPIRSYTNDILKLSNPFAYYNTGVVVFNVREYNRHKSFDRILDIVSKKKLIYLEQDALNIFFKDKFYTLPKEWNYELAPSLVKNLARFDFYDEYKKVEDDAKVLHFLGRYKPWKNVKEYKADIWWDYARQTPFYEDILHCLIQHQASVGKPADGTPQLRNEIFKIHLPKINSQFAQLRKEFVTTHFPNINNRFVQTEKGLNQLRSEIEEIHFPYINNHFAANEKRIKLMFVMEHLWPFRFKKLRYFIMKTLSFGKRHEKYKAKLVTIAALIKDARILKKELYKI